MMKLNEDFDEQWDKEWVKEWDRDEHKRRRLLRFIIDYAEEPITKSHIIYKLFKTGIFNNLIEYFEELEEYENCSILMKISQALRRYQYTEGEFFLFK